MRAVCLIRLAPVYRREAFVSGLKRAGYQLVEHIKNPEPCDLLVGWNCYGNTLEQRNLFESRGAKAVIVENGYLNAGKHFAMALHDHAGLGSWPEGGPERWDGLGIELQPWQTGKEVVILGQRGIGSPDVASPPNWAEKTRNRIGGRIRVHPGKDEPAVSLADDLRKASAVVTWGSSAALLALTMGIPVWYDLRGWIGAGACKHVSEFGQEPKRDGRLEMFRRLAWAQSSLEEIQSGEAFARLTLMSPCPTRARCPR